MTTRFIWQQKWSIWPTNHYKISGTEKRDSKSLLECPKKDARWKCLYASKVDKNIVKGTMSTHPNVTIFYAEKFHKYASINMGDI